MIEAQDRLRVPLEALKDLLDAARIAANACDILADECRMERDPAESIWRDKATKARAAIANWEPSK